MHQCRQLLVASCLSPSDLLVFVGGIVSVHPRELLTPSGALVPVGLTIGMFQLMTSWVKADVSSERPFLAMRWLWLCLKLGL